MLDKSLLDWLYPVLGLVGALAMLALAIDIAREYVRSKRIRSRFFTSLARMRALDWMMGIGRDRQKRLTYQQVIEVEAAAEEAPEDEKEDASARSTRRAA